MADVTNIPPSEPAPTAAAAEIHGNNSHQGLTNGQVGAIAGTIVAFVFIVLFTIFCVVHRRKHRARLIREYRHAVRDYEKAYPPAVKKPKPAKTAKAKPTDEEPEYIPGGPKYPTYRAVPPKNPMNLSRSVW